MLQVFKYDRFIDATFTKCGRTISNPVMAFGSLCPGKRYALLQLKWYLLTVINRFELRFPDGQEPPQYDIRCYGHEVLPPLNDVTLLLQPRRDSVRLLFD